jgi:hypothetical protein
VIATVPIGFFTARGCAAIETFFTKLRMQKSGYFDPQQNAQLSKPHVSQSCVIIGFPDGLIDTTHPTLPLPVWKTGHIASEPESDFKGQPIILIDGFTRPGQSGGACF